MAVLSIQSHVVAGYVGNSAAVFCLERLGVDVWGLNTLQFSNHAGYEGFTGEVFSPEHIRSLIMGVERCMGFAGCDAVLSGYIGKADIGREVLGAVRQVKAANPNAIYCCDPVMGDQGGIYVSQEIPDFMKKEALPLADIITPNHFELELLTGREINTVSEAVDAARELIRKGQIKVVLVTSFQNRREKANEMSVLSILPDDAYQVVTPRLFFNEPLAGTGDMIASVFLAYWLKSRNVEEALSRAVSAVFGIISRTAETGKTEIQLILAQDELVSPTQLFKSLKI